MASKVVLTELLHETITALGVLDASTLEQVAGRLDAVVAGTVEWEREPIEAITASHKLLASVLTLTEKNLNVLRRLHTREMGAEWGR